MVTIPEMKHSVGGKARRKRVEGGSSLSTDLQSPLAGPDCLQRWPSLFCPSHLKMAFLSTWRHGLTSVPPMPGSLWTLGVRAQGSRPSVDTDQRAALANLLKTLPSSFGNETPACGVTSGRQITGGSLSVWQDQEKLCGGTEE